MDENGRTTLSRSGLVTGTSGLTADVSDTVMTYDADGLLLTSTTDPSGLNLTTTNTYDALGRTKTTKDPLNRTTTFTYDDRGNLLTTKLPDNRQHTATYDALSRLKTSTDPKNQTLTYTYWYETGQTLTLKDAKNQTTTWTYNLRGQILTKVYPNSDDHAYTYDALGRMATHTTPKNEVCTYSYDLRDRQTLANWGTSTPDTARTYWANGLIKSIDNGLSRSDYAYNSRNLLTSETQTLSGLSARVVSHGYDADGLRIGTTYPSAQALDYAWTARAQLKSVSTGGPPPLATYTYDKAGRTTAIVHENGITESKTYDAASQLLANTHLNGSTPVTGHGYTLDSTGRRTAETFTDGTTATRSYGYDLADQVTSATYGGALSDSYAYDPAGNRSTATIASLGGSTTTYTANSANQYSTISGMSAPSHDSNGNLTSQNGVTYTWDSENRLLSVTPNVPSLGDQALVHSYDGQHRRVIRTLREWTSTGWQDLETLHYVYDGWNVIEESTLISSTATLVRTRTWGSDLSGSMQGAGGVGGLLLTEEIGTSTTAYHFQYDGNGNVTEITDLSGNPAASYRYDAFGNTLVATGSYAAANKYRFSTKPLDSEVTNAPLYYYAYRFYDPVTGRWPSRDPIEESGGINLYGFLGNRCLDSYDVLGNSWITVSDPLKGAKNDDETWAALWNQGKIGTSPPSGDNGNVIQYGQLMHETIERIGCHCIHIEIDHRVDKLSIAADRTSSIGQDVNNFWGYAAHEIDHIRALNKRYEDIAKKFRGDAEPCYATKAEALEKIDAIELKMFNAMQTAQQLEAAHTTGDGFGTPPEDPKTKEGKQTSWDGNNPNTYPSTK